MEQLLAQKPRLPNRALPVVREVVLVNKAG